MSDRFEKENGTQYRHEDTQPASVPKEDPKGSWESRPEPSPRPLSPYSKEAWAQKQGKPFPSASGWQPQENKANKPSGNTTAPVQRHKAPAPDFVADKTDGVFAAIFWILGFLFLRWWVIFGSGFRMGAFTLVYVAAVLWYLRRKKLKPAKTSWFWLAMLCCCAAGYVLWGDDRENGYWLIQMAFLLGCAVYWVLSAAGVLVQGRTGNWMVLDVFRGFVKLPFGNFGCMFLSMRQWLVKLRQGKNLVAVLIGLVLCIPVLGIVLPLLIDADRGFAQLIGQVIQDLVGNLFSILLYALFAIPVGCYLFGLVGGSIHRRRTQVDRQGLEKTAGSFRMIPDVSVYTVLLMVGVVYLVFIGLQFGYLFAALAGQFPGAYESYAEYARAGFFELCAVAAFNGVLLLAAGCLSKKSGRESGMLRLLNLAISVMTLLLLATAMSKMALYVDAYGLSVRRVLPSWFMIFMGLCCVLVMVLQFKHFSIVRGIAVLGSVMFVLLCLTDVGGLVAGYNLRQYQEGSLPNLSMEFLYDCGYGGISPAQELYQQTDDPVIRQELEDYLERMQIHAYYDNEHWESMTVQSLIAQSRLQNFGES